MGKRTAEKEQITKLLTINGTEINYLEKGAGVPVIFVHGSLGDWRSWTFQIDPFSESFHVISYSRRYHYPNQWTGNGSDYSVALHANDLSSLMRMLKIAPAHLIGNSYGAYITLYTAIKDPQLVRSLVLGEPPILPWLEDTARGKNLRKRFTENAFNPSRESFLAGNMEGGVGFFIDGVLGEGAFSRMSQKAKDLMMDNAEEMKAETTANDYFSALSYEDVEKITCPVLLLTGERSPEMFHLIVDKLQECLPGSIRLTVPDASHSMQTGNPQFYNSKVTEFLKKGAL